MTSYGPLRKQASALKEYIELANAGQEPWMIVASTSEQGLLRMFCKISEEEAGKDRVVTHDIGECGSRMISTEFKANNTGVGFNCMTAIAQLIRRQTTTALLATITSTRDVAHKPRAQVFMEQKTDGFVLLCVNDPPDGPVSERLRTIASVSRNVASCVEDAPEQVCNSFPKSYPHSHTAAPPLVPPFATPRRAMTPSDSRTRPRRTMPTGGEATASCPTPSPT